MVQTISKLENTRLYNKSDDYIVDTFLLNILGEDNFDLYTSNYDVSASCFIGDRFTSGIIDSWIKSRTFGTQQKLHGPTM